jgi:hypothetical protein
MALQSSGQISLIDIATEYSDTAPHSLLELRDTAGLSGVTGIKDFYGLSSVIIPSVNYAPSGWTSTNAGTFWEIDTDFNSSLQTDGGTFNSSSWVNGDGAIVRLYAESNLSGSYFYSATRLQIQTAQRPFITPNTDYRVTITLIRAGGSSTNLIPNSRIRFRALGYNASNGSVGTATYSVLATRSNGTWNPPGNTYTYDFTSGASWERLGLQFEVDIGSIPPVGAGNIYWDVSSVAVSLQP